jgi:hypothetical protein
MVVQVARECATVRSTYTMPKLWYARINIATIDYMRPALANTAMFLCNHPPQCTQP